MRTRAGLVAAVALTAAFAAPSASASNPSAVGAAAPTSVAQGHSTLLTVAVTPGADPTSTNIFVSCNLSSLGGAFSELFSDDGADGDAAAHDLVFSYRARVSPTASLGQHMLPCVVSDSEGRSTFTQIALTVQAPPNEPPTADAGGPYRVDEGGTITLAGSGSDPEGRPLSYAWDLNGDGVFETLGQSASFSPDDGPATRVVSLRVTDDTGASAVALGTVRVANVAPTATFNAPATASGGPFNLALTAPHDPSAADGAAGYTYAFDCGNGYGGYAAAAATTCPAAAGRIGVGARIRDKDGGVSEYRGFVDAGATFGSLCDVTRSLSRKPRVAEALCKLLAKAEHARGTKKRRRYLRAYRRGVRAQTGRSRRKAFTPHDGALLQSLARRLERP